MSICRVRKWYAQQRTTENVFPRWLLTNGWHHRKLHPPFTPSIIQTPSVTYKSCTWGHGPRNKVCTTFKLTRGSARLRVGSANTAQGHAHESGVTDSRPLLLQPLPHPIPVHSNSTSFLYNNSSQYTNSLHLNMIKGLRVLWKFISWLPSSKALHSFNLNHKHWS